MPLELENGTIFLHVPRTGGTFATAVFRELGIVKRSIGRKHDCPGVCDIDMTKPMAVFVRHPYDWIRSVYAYQTANGWPKWPKDVDDGRWWHPFAELNGFPESNLFVGFDDFLEWLATSAPGFATRTFCKFADWPNATAYDTDDMESALVSIVGDLCSEGRVRAAVDRIRRTPSVNRMPNYPNMPDDLFVGHWFSLEQIAYERWFA